MEYNLKLTPNKDYVFGAAPLEHPNGKVEINAINWHANPDKDDIISAKAIGMYLVKFNRNPIRYYIYEVVYGSMKQKTIAPVSDPAELNDELKQQVITLIENS